MFHVAFRTVSSRDRIVIRNCRIELQSSASVPENRKEDSCDTGAGKEASCEAIETDADVQDIH
jgi:hypothetical protein